MSANCWVDGYWADGYWADDFWPTSNIGQFLRRLLLRMEKKSIGYTLIDYLYIEPGLADFTPLDALLTNRLEKKSIGIYVFEPDVVEPGLDNDNSTRRLLEKK